MPFTLSRATALVLSAILAGCGSVVPSTLAELNRLDPMTADPAQIEVALILPPGLAVAENTARLDIRSTRGSETLAGNYVLQEVPASVSGPAAVEGGRASLFRLAAADVPKVRALQAKAADWKATDQAGGEKAAAGSLSVGLGGCTLGAGPTPDARASVLIRTASDAPLLPVINDAPLRQLVGPALFDAMTPCPGAQ